MQYPVPEAQLARCVVSSPVIWESAHLDSAMAVLCCNLSAASISGTRCRGECRTCRKHRSATTAWLAAMRGLASGTTAMLANTAAVCSRRNTDDPAPRRRTASTSVPAVFAFSAAHVASGSRPVMLASAAADSNSVSSDRVLSTRSAPLKQHANATLS